MTLELLNRFCAKEWQMRDSLKTPYSYGKWTYATDGRVIVRVPRMDEVPERAEAPGKSSANLIATEPKLTGMSALVTDIVFPAPWWTRPCLECVGHKPPRETTMECVCEGDGDEYETAIPIKFGRHTIAHLYLGLLALLPGCKLMEVEDSLAPIPFTFDGGTGRQMPMRV